MKRTILFTTALATAAGLFAIGAAQASDRSEKGEARNAYANRYIYMSGEGSEYGNRNLYRERNEYTERNEYREHEGQGHSESDDEGSDD